MSEVMTADLSTASLWQKKVAKYFTIAKTNTNERLAYVTNILARSATVILRIWIFTQLYEVTYRAVGVEAIDGLKVPVVIWMLMLTQSFQMASRPTVANIITDQIRSGDFAYYIGRPYHYLLATYSSFLGRYVPNLFSNLIIGIVAVLILAGTHSFGWQGIFFGSFILFLGLTVDCLINTCIGLSALWVEDTIAFQWIYQKGQIAFGGVMLPIALFPEKFKTVAEMMPFSQLFYSGARLMVNFDWSIFQRFFLIQLFWIALFGFLALIIFKRGIRNVSINGG